MSKFAASDSLLAHILPQHRAFTNLSSLHSGVSSHQSRQVPCNPFSRFAVSKRIGSGCAFATRAFLIEQVGDGGSYRPGMRTHELAYSRAHPLRTFGFLAQQQHGTG